MKIAERVSRGAMFGLGVSIACTAAPAAYAQDNPQGTAPAEAQDDSNHEIIVTATRRAERLQDVPLAVTAIGGKELTDRGVKRLDDLIRLVPGLAYNTTGPAISNVFMRGITTSNQAITQSSTVGFYVDESPVDVSYGARSTVDLRTFDLERIEALRGPQGTLFGAQSLSGAVRLITTKPKLDRSEVIAEVTEQKVDGGGWGGDYNLAMNVPLIDGKLAVRATGYYTDYAGYVSNLQTGKTNINDGYAAGGRLAARYRPLDNLTIDAMLVHQVTRPNHDGRTYLNPISSDVYTTRGRVSDNSISDYTLGSFTVNAGLGFADLISVTSYSEKEIDSVSDDTARGAVVAQLFFGAAAVPNYTAHPTVLSGTGTSKFFTQEVRLSSSTPGPFRWTLGGYYAHKSGGFTQTLIGQDFGTLQPALIPGGNLLSVFADVTQREESVFGELTFAGLPHFEATIGGRYFDNRQTFALVKSGRLFGLTAPVTDPRDIRPSDGFNPKFSIAFKPSSSLNLYVQAARGFRTGGFNSGVSLGSIQRSYGSDSLWNYELGLKSNFLDGAVHLNAAAYYIDWKDIQVGLQQGGFSYTANAGNARSKGLEVEAAFRPVEGFSFGESLSISRSELTTDVPFLLQSSGILGAFKGDRLPGSPQFTSSAYAQLDFPIGDKGGFIRADHQYVGKAFSGFRETGVRFGGYNLIGLRAGINFKPFEATVFVNNLLNEDKPINALDPTSLAGVQANPAVAFRLQPRTIGLTLRASF